MANRAGREAVEAICRALLRDLPELSPQITHQIRSKISEYDVVPFEDHVTHVQEQQARLVTSLMEARGADSFDLQRAADLGRLRAEQGVSVEGVIGAYHVGNRELWHLLDEYVVDGREYLPELAGFMWESIEGMTTVIAAAHSSVTRARHTQDLTLRHRLVELLIRGTLGREAEDVAASLGFTATTPFLGAAIAFADDEPRGSGPLQQRLDQLDGLAFVVQSGPDLVVLAQRVTAEEILAAISGEWPDTLVGVGMSRSTLAGASTSLEDAMRCLASTGPHRETQIFERDWWRATVVADRDRLLPLVVDRQAVIAANPRLVETVTEFVESGLSVAATARNLHVHANSVSYRLERWKELTGWNPRTFSGATLSYLACTLS